MTSAGCEIWAERGKTWLYEFGVLQHRRSTSPSSDTDEGELQELNFYLMHDSVVIQVEKKKSTILVGFL